MIARAFGAAVRLAGVSSAFSGQVVILTGASAGIGEALALELSGQGPRLVLAARDADRLNALAAR